MSIEKRRLIAGLVILLAASILQAKAASILQALTQNTEQPAKNSTLLVHDIDIDPHQLPDTHINALDVLRNNRQIYCMPYSVYSVSWSINNKFLAAGIGAASVSNECPYSGTTQIFDVTTSKAPKLLQTLPEGLVHSVAFSPDGKELATVGADKMLRIYNAMESSFPLLKTVPGAKLWLRSVTYNQDGTKVITGGSDSCIRAYNTTKTYSILSTLLYSGLTKIVLSLNYNHNGTLLAAGGYHAPVKIYSGMKPSASPLHTLHDSTAPVRCLAFSPDDTKLATVGNDRILRIYDAVNPSFPLLHAVEDSTAYLGSLAFNREGTLLATGGGDKKIRIYDVMNPSLPLLLSLDTKNNILSLAFSPDDTKLAAGGVNGMLMIFDATKLSPPPEQPQRHPADSQGEGGGAHAHDHQSIDIESVYRILLMYVATSADALTQSFKLRILLVYVVTNTVILYRHLYN